MAARIPQEFLDQLLSRVDLVEIIDRRVPVRKAGRNFVARCPFHTEKTPSFTVSPVKQFYYCFGCGAHGDAIGFLMAYERLGFVEAVEDLARAAGLEMPQGVTAEPPDDWTALIERLEQAGQWFRRQLREHRERQRAVHYLRSRGLTGEIAQAFGLGYAPPGWDNLLKALTAAGASARDLAAAGLVIEQDNGEHHDRFRDRIMFPIRDRRGRTIAFGGRALDDATPKYLNSPETPVFHKGRELYGLYEARLAERQPARLLVVEGYLDVIALAQHGIRTAVATLGTAVTSEHLERLFRAGNEVLFCFDGDEAGRKAAWRALEQALPLLRDGRQAGFLFLPEGEDPDSLVRKEGPERFGQRLSQALPLAEYLFEQLCGSVAMHTIDGRARLAERALPLLNKLPDGVYRDMLLQRLSELTGLARDGIARRLAAPEPAVTRPERRVNPNRTPVRLAIAHLLNRPALARRAGDMARLRGLEVAGLALLVELIETLRRQPQITTAAQLLTRYDGTKTGQILQRLAQWQPELLSEEQCEKEFLDILVQLAKRHTPEKPLLDKFIRGELRTAEEKEKLRIAAKSRDAGD